MTKRNGMKNVDGDTFGGPDREVMKYEVWVLSGAVGYVGKLNCANDASRQSVCK